MSSIREGTDTKTLPGSVILSGNFIGIENPDIIRINTTLGPISGDGDVTIGPPWTMHRWHNDMAVSYPEGIFYPGFLSADQFVGNEVWKNILIVAAGSAIFPDPGDPPWTQATFMKFEVNVEGNLRTLNVSFSRNSFDNPLGKIEIFFDSLDPILTIPGLHSIGICLVYNKYFAFLKKEYDQIPADCGTVLSGIETVPTDIIKDFSTLSDAQGYMDTNHSGFAYLLIRKDGDTVLKIDIPEANNFNLPGAGTHPWYVFISHGQYASMPTPSQIIQADVFPAYMNRTDKLQGDQIKINSAQFFNDETIPYNHADESLYLLTANITDKISDFNNQILIVRCDYSVINGEDLCTLRFWNSSTRGSAGQFWLLYSDNGIDYFSAGTGSITGFNSNNGDHTFTSGVSFGNHPSAQFIGILLNLIRGDTTIGPENEPYGFLPYLHKDIRFKNISFEKQNIDYFINTLDQASIQFSTDFGITSSIVIERFGNLLSVSTSPNIGSFNITINPGDQTGTIVSSINNHISNNFLQAAVLVPGDMNTIPDQSVTLEGYSSVIASYSVYNPSGKLDSVQIKNKRIGVRNIVLSTRAVIPQDSSLITTLESNGNEIQEFIGNGSSETTSELGEFVQYKVRFASPGGASLIEGSANTTPILEELKIKIR